MKNFNLSTFLGCCVISAGIIVAGWLISSRIPDSPTIPPSLTVTTSNMDDQYDDYLTKYDVQGYLGVAEENLDALLESGELDSVYTKIGTSYVFSKAALQEWVEGRISANG